MRAPKVETAAVIGHEPKKKRLMPWGDDPWSYYQTHYPGMGRKKLGLVDGQLARALVEKGLWKNIPLKSDTTGKPKRAKKQLTENRGESPTARKRRERDEHAEIRNLRENNPLEYCKRFYPGATQRGLILLDWNLRQKLKKRGELEQLPKG